MPDIAHLWGNDLTTSPSGDLSMVLPLSLQNQSTLNGNDEGTQRLYRRLMTRCKVGAEQSGEYIFAPDYGGGLPQKIGTRVDAPSFTAQITKQVNLESAVAQIPPPQVSLTATATGEVFATVNYTNAQTGIPLTLAIDPSQI
jgi:hypothetical protein